MTYGAVASPHFLATRAGHQALADGGSAVDAAIVTAAVLAVVAPDMCGLGGDAVALVADPGGRVTRYQGAGRAAQSVDVDEVRRAGGGRMPLFGVHTVTVPGAVSTWDAMHRGGGRLPWARLFEPATDLATGGVAVGPGLAESVRDVVLRGEVDAGLRDLLMPGGSPLGEGDQMVQPALATTIETIAGEGAAAVYGGRVGDQLVGYLRAAGSALALDDFVRHSCDVGAPAAWAWRGSRLWTAPPPSQGLTLFQILQLVSAVEAVSGGPLDWLGGDAGLLARVFARATTDREAGLADPGAEPVDVEAWLSSAGTRSAAARIVSQRPDGDTVAVVAADTDGGFVSLIFSLFYGFGSGLRDPATGIVLHNRGAGFSVDPGSRNLLGPGRRPAHSLMPLLVGDVSQVTAAHGTMGGYGQPQIHAQLLLRLAAGDGLQTAVSAPRFVVGRADDGGPLEVSVESAAPPFVQAALRSSGLPTVMLRDLDHEVGHAQLVRREPDGRLVAATDPRAEGAGAP